MVREQFEGSEVDRFDVQLANGNKKIRITGENYVSMVEVRDGMEPDEVSEDIHDAVKNIIMSEAPDFDLDDHHICIYQNEGELITTCYSCGMRIALQEEQYSRMNKKEQIKAKKWMVGFFLNS